MTYIPWTNLDLTSGLLLAPFNIKQSAKDDYKNSILVDIRALFVQLCTHFDVFAFHFSFVYLKGWFSDI